LKREKGDLFIAFCSINSKVRILRHSAVVKDVLVVVRF
jgi:hypothetical protein